MPRCALAAKSQSRTNMGEREVYKEELDVFREDEENRQMWHGEVWYTRQQGETIAILGDRWWPLQAKQEGDNKISKKNLPGA